MDGREEREGKKSEEMGIKEMKTDSQCTAAPHIDISTSKGMDQNNLSFWSQTLPRDPFG